MTTTIKNLITFKYNQAQIEEIFGCTDEITIDIRQLVKEFEEELKKVIDIEFTLDSESVSANFYNGTSFSTDFDAKLSEIDYYNILCSIDNTWKIFAPSDKIYIKR